ncbi:MAG: hypothetical protein ABIG87_02390 [Patescibacteria group bacterium]
MCECNLLREITQIVPGTPDFVVLAEKIARANGCELVVTDKFTEFYEDNDRALEIQREMENVFG